MVSHWVRYGTEEPFVPNLDKFGFVYLITNTKTTKAYVGCKQYFIGKKKTRSQWEQYTGSSKYLNADIEKIGKEYFTFEVIAEYKNKRSLQYYEAYYQIKWNVLTATIEGSDEQAFYNGYVGGKFYRPIESFTPEFSQGCRERNLGDKNPMFGKKRSDEDKEKIKNALKKYYKNNPAKKGKDSPNYGKKHSEESKQKISKALKKFIKDNPDWVPPRKGKPISEEQKQKQSKAMSGVLKTEEHKKKITEGLKKYFKTEKGKLHKAMFKTEEHKKNIIKGMKGGKKCQ